MKYLFLISTKIQNFQAPIYKNSNFRDYKLLKQIKKYKPRIIIINIGGGIQEILAEFINRETNFKVSIICTGAAIGFLTGTQAPINSFLDKIYLGWFVRLIFDPKKYFTRTIKSFNLVRLFF